MFGKVMQWLCLHYLFVFVDIFGKVTCRLCNKKFWVGKNVV